MKEDDDMQQSKTSNMSEYEQILAIQKMNRDEKRKLAKKLKISYQELLNAINFKIEDVTIEQLPEGTKVKLKADEILERKEELTDKFINWVEEHRNDIFTCERDPSLPDDTKRVVFKEDTTDPKWLFHVTDLTLADI